jgi:hypothetical protein
MQVDPDAGYRMQDENLRVYLGSCISHLASRIGFGYLASKDPIDRLQGGTS